tara:strand:- start:804 stop:1607 length:804 start_codon:yes stop_codon:yes gene_type:complete
MKNIFKTLLFIFIFSSTLKNGFSHEFWIDPINYHLEKNNHIIAKLLIGENFQGSQFPYSKKEYEIINLYSGKKKTKVKGRLGDIPAINTNKGKKGINILQVISGMNYLDYKGLLKFDIFSRKKGYRNLVEEHHKNNYPINFVESYKRYAKSIVSIDNYEGSDVDTGMQLELIFLDNPLIELNKGKKILLEYKNKILQDHQVSIMSIKDNNFKVDYFRTNKKGIIEYKFKKNTKYLIDSVVIIKGSNKKKDKYAKWHSLWTSYSLRTP